MRHTAILTSLILVLTLLGACQDEKIIDESSDRLVVSANTTSFEKSRSRSGDIAYRMFVVEDPDKDWLDTDNSLVESPDVNGVSAYTSLDGGVMTGDNMPTLFKQRRWYFYGVTLSTATDPNQAESNTMKNGVPQYHIVRAEDGTLPDVRWGTSHTAYGIAEASGGVVPVDFTHVCSRLEIYISHATIKANGEAWTDNETLQELNVSDFSDGTLDMRTGEVTFADNEPSTTVHVVTESNAVEFGVDSRLVTSQFLIFAGSEVKINAKVSGRTTEEGTVIRDADGNPITFEPNVSYKLFINYLEDGTYVITAFPQYYDWVDVDDGELSIGQPTLINGVVWADRNLGASSASYSNLYEWEEMRGYYYQVCRNIPYKVYPVPGNSCTQTYNGAGATNYAWVQTCGDVGNVTSTNASLGINLYPYIRGMWEYLTDDLSGNQRQMPFTYEFSANGGWSTSENFNNNKNHFYSDEAATEEIIDPGDGSNMFTKSYLTLRNTSVKDASGNERILYIRLPHTDYYDEYLNRRSRVDGMTYDQYMLAESEKLRFVPSTYGSNATNNQWVGSVTKMWTYALEDRSNALQPCPAGWRIPTCDEWASIFPVSELTGDITFNPSQSTHKDKYTWSESTKNDPTNGFEARYYCVRDQLPTYNSATDDNPVYGDLYIIKKYGTHEAYGLKISLKILTGDPGSTTQYPRPDTNKRALDGRGIIVITRYSIDDPADAVMDVNNPPKITNRGTDDERVVSLNKADANVDLVWRPVETLALPACGVAHYRYNRLIWSGTEAQYAAVDKDGRCGVARIKVAGSITSRYVYIDRGTYSNNSWSFARRFVGLSIRPVRDASVIW